MICAKCGWQKEACDCAADEAVRSMAGSVDEFMNAQNTVEVCDHDWIWIDDSFDTGMGYDHKCGHGECSKCGESKD